MLPEPPWLGVNTLFGGVTLVGPFSESSHTHYNESFIKFVCGSCVGAPRNKISRDHKGH
jgi:hypothetical protein